ncbi:MAG: hypothetical protein SGILL_004574 [Bacillariaceae sp.]
MIEVVSSKGVEYLDKEEDTTTNSDDGAKRKSSKSGSKKDRDADAREGYKGNLFLVLEYVSHDLTGIMDVAYKFTEVQVKSIFKQLLEALHYMHQNKYVHRDIKSSNILIDHNFRVKLADFGLARSIEPPLLDKLHDRKNTQAFTNKVITLWYRPPELILGETHYGTAVDIWSAGCILAELILGRPLFTGKTDMDQLQLIFDLMGTPAQETWTVFRDLKLLRTGEVKIEKAKRPKFRERYQHKIPPLALSLIEKCLELNPNQRITCARALQSRYFLSEPRAPDRPEDLGPIQLEGGHFHEFQTKKKRREAKAEAEKIRQTALDGGHDAKSAQEIFDATYREIMERVAQEGLEVVPKSSDRRMEVNEDGDDGDKKKSPPSNSGRRMSSSASERDKHREKRKERRGRKGEKDGERSKDKERRHRDRDTERRKSESSEERRKRKKRDKERRRSREESTGDSPLLGTEATSAPSDSRGVGLDRLDEILDPNSFTSHATLDRSAEADTLQGQTSNGNNGTDVEQMSNFRPRDETHNQDKEIATDDLVRAREVAIARGPGSEKNDRPLARMVAMVDTMDLTDFTVVMIDTEDPRTVDGTETVQMNSGEAEIHHQKVSIPIEETILVTLATDRTGERTTRLAVQPQELGIRRSTLIAGDVIIQEEALQDDQAEVVDRQKSKPRPK